MNTQPLKTDTTIGRPTPAESSRQGILRWAAQMMVALVLFGAVMFLAAGKLDWTAGWIYLGLNALAQLLSGLVLIPRQPDMLNERSKVREGTKRYDRFLAPAIVFLGTLAVLITAGLDIRFGWSTFTSLPLLVFGLLLAFGSQMFVLWAMASNPFFAATVRIQDDRGQQVIAAGPYRLVRHPGYAGSLIYNLALPLVFGSLWTYLPVLLTIALLVIRTALEDRTLQMELPGYKNYTKRTRFRLIPGIW